MFGQGFTAYKVLLHILAYLFFVFQQYPGMVVTVSWWHFTDRDSLTRSECTSYSTAFSWERVRMQSLRPRPMPAAPRSVFEQDSSEIICTFRSKNY